MNTPKIKANELRIGNIIMFTKANGEQKYHEVHPHDIEEVYDNEERTDCHCVELTEEWLLKFGFETHDNWQHTWLFKNGFGVNYHAKEWYWNDLSQNRKLEYVHSLQNLYFAITGEELQINHKA